METKLKCPCCGYKTLEGNPFETCPVCFWENDYYQELHPIDDGGANRVCLLQARENFKKFGASESIFIESVRPPNEDEM